MGTFHIFGSAERRVSFDVMAISITFIWSGTSTYLVSKKVMCECESFLEKIASEGISADKFTLISDDVSEDKYRDSVKYSAQRKIELKIPFDMRTINRIRQIADDNKGSMEFNLSYELSDENRIRDELLLEALLDSKKKAEELASALGLKVLGIVSIDKPRTNGIVRVPQVMPDTNTKTEVREYLATNKIKAKADKLSEFIDATWEIE